MKESTRKILENAKKLAENKSGMSKNLTLEETGQLLRGNPLHAWYSTEHAIKSGNATYKGLDGKPVAATLVCWSKERGETWIKGTNYTDYDYVGVVTPEFLEDCGAIEIML